MKKDLTTFQQNAKTGSFVKEPVLHFVNATIPISSYHIQGNRCFII